MGCVVGLALGDALGAPFEASRATEIPDPLPALALPWRGRPPGTTTDDTALARNLVRSLAAHGGLNPADVAARHLDWLLSEPREVGTLTRLVLERMLRGFPTARAARAVWEERGPEVSAGNGSVMYCAPLGAAYVRRPSALFELAPTLSRLTHFDPRCQTACLAVCLATAALVRGEGRRDAVRTALVAASPRDGGEELEFLVEAIGHSRPVDGPDRGFCLYAAALGLQAVVRGGAFDQELARVVSLGGDTDTNAAVAGALVGAAVGRSGLPEGWLRVLADRDEIVREAEALAVLAEWSQAR